MTKLKAKDTAQTSRVFNPIIVPSLEALTVSIQEAAHALGIEREAAYAEVKGGRLRVIRVGHELRVPRIELNAYITRLLEKQNQTPRTGNAGRSRKSDQLLHAALTVIQCVALLALVMSYALEVLSVDPLEILCCAVIVYTRGMLRDAKQTLET